MIFRDSSISRKLTWLTVLVSGAALIITGVALLLYDQASYRRILVENASAQADVIARSSVSAMIFNDPDSARNTLRALDTIPTVVAASLFTPKGDLFASYSRSGAPTIAQLSHVTNIGGERFEGSYLVVTRPLHSGDKIIGYVVVRSDASGLRTRRMNYMSIVGVVLLLSLLAAVGLSTAFRRAVVGPIISLADAARSISTARDYSVRVPAPNTRDELTVLVSAFNEMISGIQSRDLALESERARLGAILDNAPVGIVVLDPRTGVTVLANQTANAILQDNLTSSNRPRTAFKLMRPNREQVPEQERPLTRALQGESIIGEEFIVVRLDGSETWVRASAGPVRDRNGEITAALLVIVAIDEQKKAQEALLRSEKLAAAGRLAASISHEINNPLESVTNLLFIALSHPSISPEVHALLAQADQELARVSHIATQTLRFYRQSSNPTSVDMGNVVDSVLQLLAGKLRNTGVKVERRYNTHERITCFEGEMRQVFTNLISNAIDAAPLIDGLLVISIKSMRSASDAGQHELQVTIADNGHGIPPELAGRIFEPFYSTKGSRGTGLGLWVSREIISKHNGMIKVRSRVGRGTVFLLRIPYVAAPLAHSAAPARPA